MNFFQILKFSVKVTLRDFFTTDNSVQEMLIQTGSRQKHTNKNKHKPNKRYNSNSNSFNSTLVV